MRTASSSLIMVLVTLHILPVTQPRCPLTRAGVDGSRPPRRDVYRPHPCRRSARHPATLLVYGGESRGLTGYSADGNGRFRLFADENGHVVSVHVDAGNAYVVTVDRQETASRVLAVDVATGKVVRDAKPSARLIDLALHP